MAKRGRPSLFTQAIADLICERMAAGESLRAICASDEMPDERTVRRWAIHNTDGFSPQYEEAVRLKAMKWADEVVDIADDNKDVNRDRLRVDTRKWLLSKVLPKVYGDKLQHTGDTDNPIKHDVTVRIIDVRDNG